MNEAIITRAEVKPLCPPYGRPTPCDVTTASWGARAIFQHGIIDLVWDRKGYAIAEGQEAVAKALGAWLDRTGLPKMREMLRGVSQRSEDVYTYEADGYRIECSPQRSYGYLYMGAWPVPGYVPSTYLVTTDGYWGVGETLAEAYANCGGKKGGPKASRDTYSACRYDWPKGYKPLAGQTRSTGAPNVYVDTMGAVWSPMQAVKTELGDPRPILRKPIQKRSNR